MSSNDFFSMIDPACFKKKRTAEEYLRIRSSCTPANATTLYKLYKDMADCPVDYPEFYKMLKEKLYYDKFICVHGTEFVYYVKMLDAKLYAKIDHVRYYDILSIVPAVRL